MDRKIFFWPLRAAPNIQNSLKEYAYSANNGKVTYSRRKLQNEQQKNVDQSKENIPFSLYRICLKFIVNNLSLVESFSGLPSLIAEDIFNTAVTCDVLSDREDDRILKKIRLFTEIYGLEMFKTIQLHHKDKFVVYYLDELSVLFPFVHSIVLSNCCIGDQHEILFQLGKLSVLNYLNLESNLLTDSGIKNLVQSRRRAKKGLENLTVLSFAKNYRCSLVALDDMVCIPSLKVVSITLPKKNANFSSTVFTVHCLYSPIHAEKCNPRHLEGDVASEWGEKLVSKWLLDMELSERNRRDILEKNRGKLPFYKSVNKLSDNDTQINKPCLPDFSEYITFVLCTCSKRRELRLPYSTSAGKRKADDPDSSKYQQRKRISLSAVDDMKLLQEYKFIR